MTTTLTTTSTNPWIVEQVAKEARRQMREQEKIERQEAARRERELRTQQLMEARKKRQVLYKYLYLNSTHAI